MSQIMVVYFATFGSPKYRGEKVKRVHGDYAKNLHNNGFFSNKSFARRGHTKAKENKEGNILIYLNALRLIPVRNVSVLFKQASPQT